MVPQAFESRVDTRAEFQVTPSSKFRILAIGDSLVDRRAEQGVPAWPEVLEESLGRDRFDVRNGGVSGHRSGQALQRLKDLSLQYQPDLVIALIGWNDLLEAAAPQKAPSKRERRDWAQHLYLLKALRHLYRRIRAPRTRRRLVALHQVDFGLPYSNRAEAEFVSNLEEMRRWTASKRARFALILWPLLASEDVLADTRLHNRLADVYEDATLSTRELWNWAKQFLQAQRDFASRRSDVIVVDATLAFREVKMDERLDLFVDGLHLSGQGAAFLAKLLERLIRSLDSELCE